jgi:hypothetical protein
MKQKAGIIAWDAALLIGVALFLFWNIPADKNLIVGLVTVLIFANCIKNHIAVYNLTGKIY